MRDLRARLGEVTLRDVGGLVSRWYPAVVMLGLALIGVISGSAFGFNFANVIGEKALFGWRQVHWGSACPPLFKEAGQVPIFADHPSLELKVPKMRQGQKNAEFICWKIAAPGLTASGIYRLLRGIPPQMEPVIVQRLMPQNEKQNRGHVGPWTEPNL